MKKLVDTVVSELNQILLGKEQQVRLALCGLLARGHLLIEDIPDLRVEARFAEATGPAQLLLSLLDREGPDAYHAARLKLLAAPDEDAMAQVLTENRWIQDRMLRPAPEMEAQAFAALDLDVAPSYVLPGLILRGAMPAIVLEKHLRR